MGSKTERFPLTAFRDGPVRLAREPLPGSANVSIGGVSVPFGRYQVQGDTLLLRNAPTAPAAGPEAELTIVYDY